MKPGDLVLIDVAEHGERRRGVVLEVWPQRVRVAYGGTTEPPGHVDPAPIAIRPESRLGRMLDLREVTWFQGANTAAPRRSEVVVLSGTCPKEVFQELRVRVQAHDAKVERGGVGDEP